MYNHLLTILLFLILCCVRVSGQTVEKRDTLTQAAITADRIIAPLSGKDLDLSFASRIVSPTGEADIIKYVQTIAGVSQGADGSSSYFVRGGNHGNNLVQLDGTRIYGTSHLLGFSSVVPQDILSSAQFHSGSIKGEYSNLLSSVLDLHTKDGGSKAEAALSLSNFFAGGGFSAPIVKGKLSLTAAARYSPFSKEYGLISSAISDFGVFLPESMESSIYDVFAKLTWTPGTRTRVALSYFRTVDDYKLTYKAAKWDKFGWGNDILNLRVQSSLSSRWFFSGNASLNRFSNAFTQFRFITFDKERQVELTSSLEEISLSGKLEYDAEGLFKHGFGYKINGARFNAVKQPFQCLLGNVWYQTSYSASSALEFQAMARGNIFYEEEDAAFFNPEGSISGTYRLSPTTGITASADYLVQYYHLIEGIPTGWSMDLIVPTTDSHRPETATQVVAGAFFKNTHHDVKAGVYYKTYDNIVFNPDPTSYFNTETAVYWQGRLHSGKGRSFGLETSYAYTGKKLNLNAAYTLSKTDRQFEDLCGGKRFPAKYDRPHILNINLDYTLGKNESSRYGLTGFFTLQSGFNETVRTGLVDIALPWPAQGVTDYYGGMLNNYRMPTYIRLDIGGYAQWNTRHASHKLNLGVYNVLNRHNPTLVYVGPYSDRHWEQLCLFPIMPSLSYKLTIR